MKNPKVCVIIANLNGLSSSYKGKPVLSYILAGIAKTKYPNYEVWLADNNSTDGSVAYARRVLPEINVTITKKLGFSSTNNTAIKKARLESRPDYYLLINNDIIITNPKWLSNLVKELDKRDGYGMSGCKLVFPDGRIQHAGLRIGKLGPYNVGYRELDHHQYDKIKEEYGATFACVLIKSEVIEKVGFLDERFFCGHEDSDYCVRVNEHGYKNMYNGKVKLVHLDGSTTSNSKSSKMRMRTFYLNSIGGFYFNKKHFKGRDRIRQDLSIFMGSLAYKSSTGLTSIRLRKRLLQRLSCLIRGYLVAQSWKV